MPALLPCPDDVQPLWSAVLAAPDDRSAHKALADALERSGDPRGRWMQLEMRRETLDVAEVHTASRQFLFDHRQRLLGPVASYRDPVHWRMQHGLMHHLALRVLSESRCQTLLEELHAAGLLTTVRSLRLLTYSIERDLLDTLTSCMPQLERLHIGPVGLGGRRLPTTLDRVLAAFPRLTHLTLPPVSSRGDVEHPTLQSLAFVSSRGQCTQLTRAHLPCLREVALGPLSSWGPRDLRALRTLRLTRLRGPSTFRARWRAGLGPDAEPVEAPAPDEALDLDPLLVPPHHSWWRDFALDGARRSIRRLDDRIDIVNFGTERVVRRASALWAADTYQAKVASWLREGWQEVRPEARSNQTAGALIEIDTLE